jgi:hypothetical protein
VYELKSYLWDYTWHYITTGESLERHHVRQRKVAHGKVPAEHWSCTWPTTAWKNLTRTYAAVTRKFVGQSWGCNQTLTRCVYEVLGIILLQASYLYTYNLLRRVTPSKCSPWTAMHFSQWWCHWWEHFCKCCYEQLSVPSSHLFGCLQYP